MRRTPQAALVAFAVLASAVTADGALLCRKRNGSVFLRDACKRREQAVTVTAPKGAPGDAGAAGARAPRVVDSAGVPVGIVAEPEASEGGTTVAIPAGARLLAVPIDRLVDRGFFFASVDCSGPRLLPEQPGAFVRQATPFRGGLYYPEDPVVEIETKSTLSVTEPADCTAQGGTVLPEGLCCSPGGFASDFGPATRALDIGALGVPPFRLEL